VQERIDNLQVYKRLLALVEELDELAKRCWSPAAATSVKSTSIIVRAIASALYEALMNE
jgi:hypothetical protein